MKSIFTIHRRLFNESEEKKSDFGWGKALGATAAIAGTMYGAKKGMFGNTIRRGYNTAYGKIGNAIGSKGMVNSAATDWAKGGVKNSGNKMQYQRDIVNKRNEFKSQFNQPKVSIQTGAVTDQPPVTSPTSDILPTTTKDSVTVNSASTRPEFNLANYSNKGPSTRGVKKVGDTTIKEQNTIYAEYQQRMAKKAEGQRIAQELGYNRTTKKQRNSSGKTKQQRTQEYQQNLQNKKNANLMGVSNPNTSTFYATPNMFQQKTMSNSSYRRKYFSIMLNIFQ